jgi:glycosyltransferase involved in cell wall biosynthesis
LINKSKTICIVIPVFNEAENIQQLYARLSPILKKLINYKFWILFIDNASSDNTVELIKEIALKDRNVRLIVNTRNFGPVRSFYHGLLESNTDATILISGDMQDPPELIPEFILAWEKGYKIALAVKTDNADSVIMSFIRGCFYGFLDRISEVPIVKNATGSGIFDSKVVEKLRLLEDPYPYFRGLLCELGYKIATIPFSQPLRTRGVTKHNFYMLFEIAMNGITTHSKMPLRLITFAGFILSLSLFAMAIFYLIMKIIYWNDFQSGVSPTLIILLLVSAVQMFFMGLIGEYIGSIHTRVRKMPLVNEFERINFD